MPAIGEDLTHRPRFQFHLTRHTRRLPFFRNIGGGCLFRNGLNTSSAVVEIVWRPRFAEAMLFSAFRRADGSSGVRTALHGASRENS